LAAILVQSNGVTFCNAVRSGVRGHTASAATDVTDLLPADIALDEISTPAPRLVGTAPGSSAHGINTPTGLA
jgi:hypothetical protein